MKPITQEDALGCGLACVAFILKKSYKKTKENHFNEFDLKRGLYCREIKGVFLKMGKNYEYSYVKRKIKFEEGDIVYIKKSKEYPTGHYLVKSKHGWILG